MVKGFPVLLFALSFVLEFSLYEPCILIFVRIVLACSFTTNKGDIWFESITFSDSIWSCSKLQCLLFTRYRLFNTENENLNFSFQLMETDDETLLLYSMNLMSLFLSILFPFYSKMDRLDRFVKSSNLSGLGTMSKSFADF